MAAFRKSLAAGLTLLCLLSVSAVCNAETLDLSLRYRRETGEGTGRFHMLQRSEQWRAEQTAVIVCDMWDLHHCLNATRRGAEIAPRMNQVLKAARDRGAVIIHAPSSCMDTYKDHPARHRAQNIPRSTSLPDEIGKWCYQIPEEERGEYPIDQTDGGEDDDPQEHAEWAKTLADKGRNPRAPWKSQTDLLDIDAEHDFISDNGEEIWSILETHNRPNVILLGVHTNMCVLGRPFGLRQMARNGKNVVLMRDMTDTMYNPLRRPFVSHFTGTDLIVEHIEKWVCPTVTSDQILGGQPFRFKHDTRPHVVVLMAEREYRTNETLPPFALQQLGQSFRVSLIHADEDERNTLPGIDVCGDADVLLVSVRRRALPAAHMDVIRRHVQAGRAIVGIRTANHAFSLRNEATPDGLQVWESWDADIIGGSYTGHHGNGPEVSVSVTAGSEKHPILEGVDAASLVSRGSLYKVSPLRDRTTALLIGTIPDHPSEPIAWTHETESGSRVFYTSLGHIGDFEQPAFRRLLTNAITWAAKNK